MSQPIIEVRELSKKYRLGSIGVHTLREEIGGWWQRMNKKAPRGNGGNKEFWAIQDVSFDVQPGEVLGIIGRNGAGKSTLLKILSRITDPTSGEAILRGRIASLLEVGTGFHPDLSGRENIYLNGAILGMKRKEIDHKFDEIVAFAEIDEFIDTPVKRYSSGMYVRLAFAVAAHLSSDVLIIDEVLAVGDATFQKKCLGKMGDLVSGSGRVVLFVSHNMSAVAKLCNRCLLLQKGKVSLHDTPEKAIAGYTLQNSAPANHEFLISEVTSDGHARLIRYEVKALGEPDGTIPTTGSVLEFRIGVEILKKINHPACCLSIWNDQGTLMSTVSTPELGTEMPPMESGFGEVIIQVGPVSYLPGIYTCSFWISNSESHVYASALERIHFEIGQKPLYGTREIDRRWGCVFTPIQYHWNSL